jgi:hypothetical protein
VKRIFAQTLLTIFGLVLFSGPVLADVPSLQVAPLSYQGALKPGVIESGYIDVANPSDQAIQVTSSVSGFRQTDTKGDLAFYSDPDLSAGITVGLANFSLGPRQAVRVAFNLDPSKLPRGGVYAAIFFRTVPSSQNSSSSYVLQSANVGTLLMLTNGPIGTAQGAVTDLSMPFWQFGSGLTGTLGFKNTAGQLHAAGFKPHLTTAILPWGRRVQLSSGLVLPGVTRDFSFNRPGSFFGLLPVTVTDADSGAHATAWVIADTGFYRLAIPLGIALLLLIYASVRLRRRPQKPVPAKIAMDGLSRKPVSPPPPSPDPVEPEPESVLEELSAAELEKDAALDLPVPSPKKAQKPKSTAKSGKSTKAKSTKPKTKPKPKTAKPKPKPKKPKP